MNLFQQNWIKFKTHFCSAHCELVETEKLTTDDSGQHQANLVNSI